MVIVFNPVAGRRRAHLLWRVLDVLVANGVRLDLAETHRAGHAEALAREAVRRGEQMVVTFTMDPRQAPNLSPHDLTLVRSISLGAADATASK